jgi:hypothetical protein
MVLGRGGAPGGGGGYDFVAYLSFSGPILGVGLISESCRGPSNSGLESLALRKVYINLPPPSSAVGMLKI